jgi:chromosome segregation ATPase
MKTRKPREYEAGFAAGIKKENEVREREIVSLQARLDDQHGRLTNAQALIADRDTKITALSQRIDELASEKSELERQNAHFISEISTLHYENSQVETLITDLCRFMGRFAP